MGHRRKPSKSNHVANGELPHPLLLAWIKPADVIAILEIARHPKFSGRAENPRQISGHGYRDRSVPTKEIFHVLQTLPDSHGELSFGKVTLTEYIHNRIARC